jgi:hypothetical protein
MRAAARDRRRMTGGGTRLALSIRCATLDCSHCFLGWYCHHRSRLRRRINTFSSVADRGRGIDARGVIRDRTNNSSCDSTDNLIHDGTNNFIHDRTNNSSDTLRDGIGRIARTDVTIAGTARDPAAARGHSTARGGRAAPDTDRVGNRVRLFALQLGDPFDVESRTGFHLCR